jgi:hypothetical protein
MGSTLTVRLCPHKVWREKYGCAKCDEAEDAKLLCAKEVTPGGRRCVKERGHDGGCVGC